MPLSTPEIKIASVKRLGGTVELIGDTFQEAQVWRASSTSSPRLGQTCYASMCFESLREAEV
jgi:hypothetical protein